MSLICPSCGNSIDQDFGVITCARCAAVLFIDMEGQIQVAEEPGAQSSEAVYDPQAAIEASPEPMPPPQPQRAPARPVMPPRPAPYVPPSMPAASSQQSHVETPAEQSFETSMEASMMETPAEHDENSNQSENAPGDFGNLATSTDSNGAGEIFSEVSEFGNTDQAFGALSYSILIEHIDTSSTRQKLFEALSDPKFQWDAKELLQQIEQGRLQLTQLNPAKASVLVRRLQDVPVKVSWDQKLL